MKLGEFSSEVSKLLEDELIHHVYETSWGQVWQGGQLPKHVFKSFLSSVRDLSDAFTRERSYLKIRYLATKEGRNAYLLYFHMASVARTLAVLEEIHRRNLWMGGGIGESLRGNLRVLDLGTGGAPSLWALGIAVQRYGGEIKELVAIDSEKKTLQDARELWKRFNGRIHASYPPLQTLRINLLHQSAVRSLARLGQFDLIFCSNTLNELTRTRLPRHTLIFQQLMNMLTESGMLIVIEPALKETSRQLTLMRDSLLSKGDAHVPIPCGHSGLCPLNQEPRDWCHFEIEWLPPPLRNRLEKALGHQSGILKYSYLVVKKGEGPSHPQYLRVISDPLETKYGNLLLLCSPLQKIGLRFDARKGSFRHLLRKCQRGDLLDISFPPRPGLYKVRNYAREVLINEDFQIEKV